MKLIDDEMVVVIMSFMMSEYVFCCGFGNGYSFVVLMLELIDFDEDDGVLLFECFVLFVVKFVECYVLDEVCCIVCLLMGVGFNLNLFLNLVLLMVFFCVLWLIFVNEIEICYVVFVMDGGFDEVNCEWLCIYEYF